MSNFVKAFTMISYVLISDKKLPEKKSHATKEVQEPIASTTPSSQPKKAGRPPGIDYGVLFMLLI